MLLVKKILVFCIIPFIFTSCDVHNKKPFFSGVWGYYDGPIEVQKSNNSKNTKLYKKDKNINKKPGIKTAKNLQKTQNIKKDIPKTIIIAGSKPHSTKYNIAGTICSYLNQVKTLNIRCLVEPTESVQYSMQHSSKYDFIISQANIDRQYLSQKTGLRSMFSLYPEVLTLITSKTSNIKAVSDLKGKKVFLRRGHNSSRIAFKKILQSANLTLADIQIVSGLNMGHALCDGTIDAIFTDINHPNTDIDEFIKICDANIMEFSGKYFTNLIKTHHEYINGIIPHEYYGDKYKKDIQSFAIMTNLIATSKVDDELAYKITATIFNNINKFKFMDPILLDVPKNDMTLMNSGLILPIHSGAEKYYTENNIKHTK